MRKIRNLFVVLAISLFAFSASAQPQTQEFYPLTSSSQFNDTTVSVTSKVRFVDNLISEKALATMDEEERKLGYASVYEYTYVFKNTGNTKVRVLFIDRNLLMSPLVHILQDFYLTLEPNEEKTVKFLANTTPEVILAGMFVMQYVETKNKWFAISASVTSFYVPRWNAIVEEASY